MIKIDIEMPIYCYDCPCHNGENGRCQISGNFTTDKRPFDCPLAEIELLEIPVDVQKVKHAHWKDECCTNCGTPKFVMKVVRGLDEVVYEYEGEANYCPNCGAYVGG